MFHNLTYEYVYDEEAAEGVLGLCLGGREYAEQAREGEGLTGDDFRPGDREVWEALTVLNRYGREAVLGEVVEWLSTHRKLEAAGGRERLEKLAEAASEGDGTLEDWAEKLRGLRDRREVVEFGARMLDVTLDQQLSPTQAIETIEGAVLSLAQARAENKGDWPVSAVELAREPAEGPTWLLRDLLVAGGLNLLAGEVSSGKTFLALDLALGVAGRGRAWDERECLQGKVLYLCQDTGRRTMRKRLLALCEGKGIRPPANLAFDFQPLNLTKECWTDDEEGPRMSRLRWRLRAMQPRLVIVDALARYLPWVDENAVSAVGPVMTALRALAGETGTTFLIIHHFNKIPPGMRSSGGLNRVRGSSDIGAAMDAALTVTVSGARAAPRRTITPEKNREAVEGDAIGFWIEAEGERRVRLRFERAGSAVRQGDSLEMMVELLAGRGGERMSREELAAALAKVGCRARESELKNAFAELGKMDEVAVEYVERRKVYRWRKEGRAKG